MIKRISPCPIIDATIQVNCTFTVDQDVVVGLIYSLLENKLDKKPLQLEKLPILNLPEDIRRNDPNLKDKPWYKINCEEYYILIGLFGIAFGVNGAYTGWESYKRLASEVFGTFKDNLIKGVSAINLKYLDFFRDVNIFEKIKCEIKINNNQITSIPTIFRTELPINKYVKVLQITNGVHVKNKNLKIDNDGSLIEINLHTKNVSIDTFDSIIEDAHAIQKESFFELLTDDFLHSFEVEEYE